MNKSGNHPRIAILGAGAVGGYYGAKLARAGHDVHFLVRSDYDSLREKGWRIESTGGDFTVESPQVYRESSAIGACDIVFIALKTTSNQALPEIIAPLLHESTILVTMQNGLGNEELLADQFGDERILGALCFVCLNRIAPGVIVHSEYGSISLGEHLGAARERTHAIAQMLGEAGVACDITDDLGEARWRKLHWNIPFNGLSIAAGGIDTEKILQCEGLTHEVELLMDEVRRGAASQGYAIEPEFGQKLLARTRTMGAYQPSSLIDFLNHRAVEVESIWGEPLARAQRAGVELPRVELLYHLLQKLTVGERWD